MDMTTGFPTMEQPSWGALAAQYWRQYVAVAAVGAVGAALALLAPHPHAIYSKTDAEIWRYSYVLTPDTVPFWLVPVLAVVFPLSLFLAAGMLGRLPRAEAHHCCLMLLACVLTTEAVTDLLKSQVGRYRPDFVARCWPDTHAPAFTPGGIPLCGDGAVHSAVLEGMRSFPSGHSSWSASGLGFVSLWLLGKMRCFSGRAQPARLIAGLLPVLAALWIGVTRVQNNKHHVEDVVAGLLLGLLMACTFYRQVYPSLLSSQAGQLGAVRVAAQDERQHGMLKGSPSSHSLLPDGPGRLPV